jgi:hypothetical protein
MPEWLWSIVVGIALAGLVSALYGLAVRRIDEQASALGKSIDERFDALWNQIGRDSQSGMRGDVHKIGSLQQTLEWFDKRITKLENGVRQLK